MLLILLCSCAFSRVVSVLPPPPPQNIQVEKGQLTWTSASEEPDINYTVEYRRYDDDEWETVPSCDQISFPVCNVTHITQTLSGEPPEKSCVMLRVRAKRQMLKSEPVEACSRNGSLCTPVFSLLALPGSLTIHLSDDHKLADEYAENAKHRIYFGKEGEKLKECDDTIASKTIKELEEGQQYCVQVEYILHGKPIGLPSCNKCAVIPASQHWNRTPVIAGVVVAIVALAIIIPTIGYLLLFQHKRIKRWLRLPYQIPPEFLDFPSSPFPQISDPPEELCDIIHISPYQPR